MPVFIFAEIKMLSEMFLLYAAIIFHWRNLFYLQQELYWYFVFLYH